MKKEDVAALFTLAGFDVSRMWKLPNGYWPDAYAQECAENPWWLVRTKFGCIEIGRRKRVWQIDWSDTELRRKITEDDTTSEKEFAHAWTQPKLLEYLTNLRKALEELVSEGGGV